MEKAKKIFNYIKNILHIFIRFKDFFIKIIESKFFKKISFSIILLFIVYTSIGILSNGQGVISSIGYCFQEEPPIYGITILYSYFNVFIKNTIIVILLIVYLSKKRISNTHLYAIYACLLLGIIGFCEQILMRIYWEYYHMAAFSNISIFIILNILVVILYIFTIISVYNYNKIKSKNINYNKENNSNSLLTNIINITTIIVLLYSIVFYWINLFINIDDIMSEYTLLILVELIYPIFYVILFVIALENTIKKENMYLIPIIMVITSFNLARYVTFLHYGNFETDIQYGYSVLIHNTVFVLILLVPIIIRVISEKLLPENDQSNNVKYNEIEEIYRNSMDEITSNVNLNSTDESE